MAKEKESWFKQLTTRKWFPGIKSFFGKIMSRLDESVRDKKGGKVSSSRLSSYAILLMINLSSVTYLVIDIVNAAQAWQANEFYTIPTEHIVLFGMLLGHHLALLGITKTAEVKNYKSEVEKALGGVNSQLKPTEEGEEEEY